MTHEQLLTAFTEITDELMHLLQPLSEQQLNTVPFEGSWTAGQLGDHLFKSYGIAAVLNGKTEPTTRPVEEKIVPVKAAFLNFEVKMKSPDFIVPSAGHFDKTILLSGLTKRIDGIKDFINKKEDLTPTCLDFELPRMGTLTRTEWIQFMTVHTVRHVHQLKRIIAALWDKVQTLKNKFQTTMDIHSISKAAKYNPVLEPLHVLIGEWKTTGKHPMMPGKVLEGHASFKWIEGGAFMIMHAYVKEKEFPEGIAIFGGDSSSEEYSMIYYDEREIARKYTSTLKDNVWNWWRNDAEFSQRFIGNISEDTNTIVLKGEMSKNGEPWEGDLELTYNRVH